ncbi:MAG: glycosyltransferase family 39 protein [Rhizomicrobium sp.]
MERLFHPSRAGDRIALPAGGELPGRQLPAAVVLSGRSCSALTGDAIVAGRIVSLAALVAVAAGIETAARQMGCTRLEALFAALLFSAGLMLTSDYAGMDDPQLLGHAVAMGGLAAALREPRTPRLMVIAALLFTLAFFVKHNLIVLPAAMAAWLFFADRRHVAVFILSGAIFC